MDNTIQQKVLRWWQAMNWSADRLIEVGIKPAPTSQKAQLKRCDDIDAAMLSEGFRVLWLSFPESFTNKAKPQDMECWATIAAALAYISKDTVVSIAAAAGKKSDSGKSIVSELRFAQLQNAQTPAEFLRRLRRLLQQVEGETSVSGLAEDIEQWFKEHYALRPLRADKRTAVRWAMDYYREASK